VILPRSWARNQGKAQERKGSAPVKAAGLCEELVNNGRRSLPSEALSIGFSGDSGGSYHAGPGEYPCGSGDDGRFGGDGLSAGHGAGV